MSTYELELDDSGAPGVVVASLSGELDLTNARELEERLEAAAPADMILVVDLNRVVFIDSAALHVLFKLALDRGRDRLSLVVEPTAPIVRTLDIVGMKDAVRIAHSLLELSADREPAGADSRSQDSETLPATERPASQS
jgi:anti-sigma B factor antagonist